MLQRFHIHRGEVEEEVLSTHGAFVPRLNCWCQHNVCTKQTNSPPSPHSLPRARLCSSLQGLQRDTVTHQRCPFCKKDPGLLLNGVLCLDAFPCALLTPFCMVTLESEGILCKARRKYFSCLLCTEHTHTHTQRPPNHSHSNKTRL